MKIKPCIGFAFAVFVWSMLFSVEWVVVVGTVVILHELSHAAMCRFFDIEIDAVRAVPWGVNMTAPVMYRPFTEFAVAASGPFMNFFLLSLCPVMEIFFSPKTVELFALANLADGFLNLIPALPLDGGTMLKALLCSVSGLVRGSMYMIRLTAVLGAVVMIFGIHILRITGTNFSYLIAGGFILFNLKNERKQIISMRKKLLTGEVISNSPVRVRSFHFSCHALRLVDVISISYTTVFRVVDGKNILGFVSQRQLMDCVMENSMITLGECVRSPDHLQDLLCKHM